MPLLRLLLGASVRLNQTPARRLLLLAAATMGLVSPRIQADERWAHIDPADLAATSSKSSPDAGIEILHSDHILQSAGKGTIIENDVQAKIYTRKGAEDVSLLAIEAWDSSSIEDVAARVIKPDGSSTELKKSAFHETTVEKWGNYIEAKKTSFAFPDVQPGDIVEYRWREEFSAWFYWGEIIFCQDRVPTREYTFTVDAIANCFIDWFNIPSAENSKGGQVTFHNLPAFVDEPLMLADTQSRGWILVYVQNRLPRWFTGGLDERKWTSWEGQADYQEERFNYDTEPNKTLEDRARQLTAGATTPDEKLSRIYNFCQQSIVNFDWTDSSTHAAERTKRQNENHPRIRAREVLARGWGNSQDIDGLFGGLARAAGFKVKLAVGASRFRLSNINFPRGWPFCTRELVAVELGDTWRFYTPGRLFVPAGQLETADEGAIVCVCNSKPVFVRAQTGQPDDNVTKKKGRFALDREGTLSGEVEIEATGKAAISQREKLWTSPAHDLTEFVRKDVTQRLPNAEVTEVKFENLTAPGVPLKLRYKVRVPGYADSVGSRLVFTLNFFQANSPEILTAETRVHRIQFEYAVHEQDSFQLTLPEGFELDGATAPKPIADPAGIVSANFKVRLLPKTHAIDYQQDYVFGNHGALDFNPASYPVLRKLLGAIRESETHQLVVRPIPAASSASKTVPASAKDS